MEVLISMNGKLETRNGKEYYNAGNVVVKVKFFKGIFDIKGLFNGNKELGK